MEEDIYSPFSSIREQIRKEESFTDTLIQSFVEKCRDKEWLMECVKNRYELYKQDYLQQNFGSAYNPRALDLVPPLVFVFPDLFTKAENAVMERAAVNYREICERIPQQTHNSFVGRLNRQATNSTPVRC